MVKKKPDWSFVILTFMAVVFWFLTFFVNAGNFWLKISISAAILAIGTFIIERPNKWTFRFSFNIVLLGILSTAILYGVFYLGNSISNLIFGFAENQITSIYDKGVGTNKWMIVLLLLFVTGPGEEIFWRGFLQERLMVRFGVWSGWLVATLIYGLVHIWSMNFMLIGAALVAGAFWGLMYMRFRNVTMLIISHSLWSCVIFAVWPIL